MRILAWPWNASKGSFKVIENGADRQIIYDYIKMKTLIWRRTDGQNCVTCTAFCIIMRGIIWRYNIIYNLVLNSDIEQVTQATLLGTDITSTLSTAAYVNRMLLQNKPVFIPLVTAQVARHGSSGLTSVIYWSYHVKDHICITSLCRKTYRRRQEQDKCNIAKGSASRCHTYCFWYWGNHW